MDIDIAGISIGKSELKHTGKMLLLVIPLFVLMMVLVFHSPLYKSKLAAEEDARNYALHYLSLNYYRIDDDAREDMMNFYNFSQDDIDEFRSVFMNGVFR